MRNNSASKAKATLFALLAAAVSQPCWANGFSDQSSAPPIPAAFYEALPATSGGIAPASNWWTIFNDPVLNDLVERAIRGNTNIHEAAARLSKARAQLRGAAAERNPQIGVNASASHQTGPLINAAGGGGSLFTVGANLSYEIDLFGRLSKIQQAARLDAEASEDLFHEAQLLNQAETVQTYFEIRELAAERAVLQDARDSASMTLNIVEGRSRRGLASDLDVERARGEQAAILSEISKLDQRTAASHHTLSYLIGEAPTIHQFPPFEIAAPPSIPADIPSVVLDRRADVVAATHALSAAALRLKITKTSWLPNFGLTASGGAASSALGDILRASAQNFGIGLLFSLPIFDGGRRKSRIEGAKADLELATAEYQTHILAAFRDVSDQLSTVRSIDEQTSLASSNAQASARAEAVLQSRVANGLASRLDLLDAQRTALKARRADVQMRFARYIATVGLIRSLGGGWNAANPAR
jgi:outer membrane protein, multidrug efflux system